MTPKAVSPSNTGKFACISTLWGCKIAAGCIYDVYLNLSASIFIYNLHFLEFSCFILYVSCILSYLICPFLFLSSLIFSCLTLPYHILAYRGLFILYHNIDSYAIASHRIMSYRKNGVTSKLDVSWDEPRLLRGRGGFWILATIHSVTSP